jgi:hypothetical protein
LNAEIAEGAEETQRFDVADLHAPVTGRIACGKLSRAGGTPVLHTLAQGWSLILSISL